MTPRERKEALDLIQQAFETCAAYPEQFGNDVEAQLRLTFIQAILSVINRHAEVIVDKAGEWANAAWDAAHREELFEETEYRSNKGVG